MDDGFATFNETHDLYLQLLSEARKLEDRRLAKMILRRILDGQQAVDAPPRLFSNIIDLPRPAIVSGPVESEMPFWMEGRFWQGLLQFMVMLSVAMSWLLYFFYLVVKSNG